MRKRCIPLASQAVRCLRNDRGQGLVEYALLIGLVALTAIIGLATIAEPVRAPLLKAAQKLTP